MNGKNSDIARVTEVELTSDEKEDAEYHGYTSRDGNEIHFIAQDDTDVVWAMSADDGEIITFPNGYTYQATTDWGYDFPRLVEKFGAEEISNCYCQNYAIRLPADEDDANTFINLVAALNDYHATT